MQLVCRNERTEPAKVLGECRVRVTVVRADRAALTTQQDPSDFSAPHTHVLSWQVGPVQPGKHSQLPSPCSPSLQMPLSQAHSAGKHKHKHHCHTSQAHQHSAAAISLPALLLIQHVKLPSRKCHRSIKRKLHRSSSSGSLSARRTHLPVLAVVWVAAGREAQFEV